MRYNEDMFGMAWKIAGFIVALRVIGFAFEVDIYVPLLDEILILGMKLCHWIYDSVMGYTNQRYRGI